jgi:molybdate transport system substrate-binding protein
MYKITFTAFIIFLAISLAACTTQKDKVEKSQEKKTDLTVSAAASLNDALVDIKTDFENKNKQIHLLLNLGGSGALQQQILQGAPVDLFVSAAKKQFDELVQKGIVNKKESSVLLGNKLVLITNKSVQTNIHSFNTMEKSNFKEIAIGDPESVPAGIYAKQTLESLGIWDKIQTKIIPTKDVRQVLTYVETGNVDAGIVYMTDAKISNKVKIVAVANEQSHDPIVYPAGIIKNSPHKKEALQFFHYLNSKHAKNIFKKYGFSVLD